jgi:D-glycero-D-manno-heptose 1,7-bisphosphate phosphatase
MSSARIQNDGRRSSVNCRAVFLDRDGVINKVILRDGKPFSPRSLEEFVLNDGIRETVSLLKDNGFKVIVVSNQPDVARGDISRNVLDRMTQLMTQEIPFDDIYICPHDDQDQCSCRKPKPGMLLEAARKWNIDLEHSYFIGDTWKDIEAGKVAGCKTILLDVIYNREVTCDFRVKSLFEATSIILASLGS